MFDDENKLELPEFPQKIGVITSPVGAAVQDIINVLSRRYPLAEVVFCPVAVQGVNCAKENINAIKMLNRRKDIDVIILGRGGGSVEDLWGYNDEQLVRSIAASKIPVITGIGHETDFTLCDFAADMRAPTPSAAAEISVPDRDELYQITDNLIFRYEKAVSNYLANKTENNTNIALRLNLLDPRRIIEHRITETTLLKNRLKSAVENSFAKKNANLDVLCEKLRLLNPLLFIEKGYIPVFADNQRIIKADNLSVGNEIILEFSDGKVFCDVTDIKITES